MIVRVQREFTALITLNKFVSWVFFDLVILQKTIQMAALIRRWTELFVHFHYFIMKLIQIFVRLNTVTINMMYDVIMDPLHQKSLCNRIFIRIKPYLFQIFCWILLLVPLSAAIGSRVFFWCYRAMILWFLRLRYGNATLLTGPETLFAQDSRTAGILTRIFILRGEVDLAHVREFISKKWVYAKTPDGQIRYPTFRQFMHYELGYFVWRDDLDFKLDDHILVSEEPKPKNDHELHKLIGKYRNEIFPPKKAAWKVILIPFENKFDLLPPEPHYGVLIMIDHTMGDGISIANLVLSHLADQRMDTIKRHAAPDQSRLNYLSCAKNVARFILQWPSLILREYTFKDNNSMYGSKLTGDMLFSITKPINFQVIKRIKQATGATVNDILLSCLSGVMRNHFIYNKLPLPKKINALIPVSMHSANEPLRFANDFSFICCHLPVSGNSPMERLMFTKYYSSKAKDPAFIWFNYICLKYAVNFYPLFFSKPFMHRQCTYLVSNVPFADQLISLWGGHTVYRYAGLLSSQDKIGCGIIFVTYNGQLQIGISIDKAFVNKQDDVEHLAEDFEHSIEELEKALKNCKN